VRSSSGRGGGASVVDDVDSVVAGGVFTAGAVVSEGSMKPVFLLTQENNVRSIIKANIIPIDLFMINLRFYYSDLTIKRKYFKNINTHKFRSPAQLPALIFIHNNQKIRLKFF
jgi:hypothetical protein